MFIDRIVIEPVDVVIKDNPPKWYTKVYHGQNVDQMAWHEKKDLIVYLRSIIDFLDIQE